ncbi:magnesium transporter [Pleomorphomonas oryzae]|uniref:magnesium transporter n=1 Tax=Pleomorphomonas oryzae TaxID=261934 RepID=UPI00040C1533|nr:magnesium transporter [Pleomorphomonas oryzae]
MAENEPNAPKTLSRGLPPLRTDDGDLDPLFLEAIHSAIETADAATVEALAADLHEADVGDIIEALSADERAPFIQLLGEHFDFTALTEVDETVRVQLIEEMPPEAVAEGVRDLDSDDAVYILEGLDDEDQEEILAKLPAVDRMALRRSLDFPEETAGRRMQTDFIAVPPFWTAGQTIDYLRDHKDLPDEFYEVFVIDPGFRFLGAVALNRLLRASRPTRMADIMNDERQRVLATDDQEDVARMFERYNLVSAAVVDDAERLVGVITVDDVVDVIQAEAEEDIRALAGVGDEEISDSVFYTLRTRWVWLLVNMLTAFLASSVIGMFSDSISKMVALAVLMPIVASMGGNAATQTMTVTVRALATRDLDANNVWRIFGRELSVGLLNGVSFAVIVGATAALWFGDMLLGGVIGAAMIVNLLSAAMAGILIPLAFERFDIDPAVASGVFVTMVTDVVGFLAFLGLASWILLG